MNIMMTDENLRSVVTLRTQVQCYTYVRQNSTLMITCR